MTNSNPFFSVFGPKEAAGKSFLFDRRMFGFGSVRVAEEKSFLTSDRGNERFGDFTITINDVFESGGLVAFVSDEGLEAGFSEVCSIGVPEFLKFSESGRMGLWSFDLFNEGWEGSIFFKGEDKLINIDRVEAEFLGGCMIISFCLIIFVDERVYIDL
jgi:hypothetical protein